MKVVFFWEYFWRSSGALLSAAVGAGGVGKQSALQRALFFLWLLRSGDRLFPLQKTVLVTSSPKDLFRQSCSGFTDLRFVPTPHFLCFASLLALSLSGIIVLDSISLSLIRALRDYCTVFCFFPGCILAIFCLGSFSRSPCLFQLRSCCILVFFFARDAPAF